ncbi:bacillolysin [Bacillus anthracis]|nr:bacillolysin [Bacillus anthracis]
MNYRRFVHAFVTFGLLFPLLAVAEVIHTQELDRNEVKFEIT